jgi:hypothetical protein
MKVRFNGGIKDVPLSEVTAANYLVPQNEVGFWHVLQEKVEYNRQTGKRMSRPVLQKYDTKAYPTTSKYLKDAGYTITVLHDPEAWAKANAEAKAKAEAQRVQAAAASKAAQAKAEREAMKAELRKELLAELKAEAKAEKKVKK